MSAATDSKYKNLPGIVSDQPDVYETTDLPEADQPKPTEERFDSEHIEKTNINLSSAFQSFRGKSLLAEQTDFSDSIVVRQKRGYSTNPTVIAIGAIGSNEPETVVEKYNRLQLEIKDLAVALEDIKKTAERTDSGTNLSADAIVSLQSQLKELQAEQILGPSAQFHIADPQGQGIKSLIGKVEELKKQTTAPTKTDSKKKAEGEKTSAARLVYELYPSGNSTISGQAVKAAELESRLNKLETVLGISDEKNLSEIHASGKTVVEAVQTMSDKVKMLDLNHLDLVEARLTVLQQKMTQINEKKQAIDGDSVAKVNEVYEMMSKWDAYCSTLPQLLSRMRSLSELHEQALQFSQALTQLDTVQQQLSKSLEMDSSLLGDVRAGLAENMEIIKTQCESIDKRIKMLTK